MVIFTERETFGSQGVAVEQVDGVSIGRITLPVKGVPTSWEATPVFLRFFNALNCTHPSSENPKPEELRRSLLFSLNHNTPHNYYAAVAFKRPVSAYFTYNPQDETVTIEWGKINLDNDEAKLHTYLNKMIDYTERVKQGMKLSSGHLAKVEREDKTYIALLDNLSAMSPRISKDEPMRRLINTLHFFGFIPITADGLVQIPAF